MGNDKCAECGKQGILCFFYMKKIKNYELSAINNIFTFLLDPKWASINLGLVLCIECSGIHRYYSLKKLNTYILPEGESTQ